MLCHIFLNHNFNFTAKCKACNTISVCRCTTNVAHLHDFHSTTLFIDQDICLLDSTSGKSKAQVVHTKCLNPTSCCTHHKVQISTLVNLLSSKLVAFRLIQHSTYIISSLHILKKKYILNKTALHVYELYLKGILGMQKNTSKHL